MILARLRYFLALRFGLGCNHQWRNTGLTYTDPQHGFTVVLRQCDLCDTTIIIEV